MKYRLALFDFDGTLVNFSLPWLVEVINEMAQRHSFKTVRPEEVPALRAMDNRALFKHLEVSTWRMPFIAREMRSHAQRDIHLFEPFPGIADLIRALKSRGIQIAIVSSNSEKNVRRVLGPELSAQIDYFQCSASLFGKARLLKKVIRKSGIPAQAAIYFGDETRDLEAAKAAGIPFGFVTWGYASEEAFRAFRPTFVFRQPAEILHAFEAV